MSSRSRCRGVLVRRLGLLCLLCFSMAAGGRESAANQRLPLLGRIRGLTPHGLPHHSPLTTHQAQLPPIFVRKAAYEVQPQGRRLRFTATLTIWQTAGGRQRLPLRLGGLSLESATLERQTAALLRSEQEPESAVFLSGKRGVSTLELVGSLPLRRVGPDHVAVLQLPVDAPSILQAKIPRGQRLKIDGVASRRGDAVAATVLRTPIGNRDRVELCFSPADIRQRKDSVVLAESRSTISLAAGLVDWNSRTRIHVTGQPRRSFELSLGGGIEITDVHAAGLARWTMPPSLQDGWRKTVRLEFHRAFTGTREVRLSARRVLPAERFWSVPKLVVSKADSHSGRVAVTFPAKEPIRVDEFAGLRQITPDSAASVSAAIRFGVLAVSSRAAARSMPKRRLLEFEFWNQNYELNLVLPKSRRRGSATAETALDVHRDFVALEFTADVPIRSSTQTMRLQISADWVVQTIVVNGRRCEWRSLPIEVDVQHLRIAVPNGTIPSNTKENGRQTCRLALTARHHLEFPEDDDAPAVGKLPVIRLADARLMQGRVSVRAAEPVELAATDVQRLKPVPLQDVAERFAYRYICRTDDVKEIGAAIAVRPKVARFSVKGLVTAELNTASLHSRQDFRIQPQDGGFETLEMIVPEQMVERFIARWRDNPARLVQQTKSGRFGGMSLWRLQFDRVVREPGRLSLEIVTQRQFTPGESPGAQESAVLVPCIQFPAADRQTGHILIVANTHQHLQVAGHYAGKLTGRKTDGEPRKRQPRRRVPLPEVQPSEVLRVAQAMPAKSSPTAGRVAAAFRYVLPGYVVRVRETPLHSATTAAVICRKQMLQTNLTASAEVRHRAVFELTVREPRELRIRLPDSAMLASVMVDGRVVTVRRDDAALLVPLPSGRTIPEAHRLEIDYHTKSAPLTEFGRWRCSAPSVTYRTADGHIAALFVADCEWTLHHPAGIDVIDSNGRFQATEPLCASSWIAGLGRRINGLREHPFAAVLILLLVGFTVTARRRRWARHRSRIYGVCGLLAAVGTILFLFPIQNGTETEESAAVPGSHSRETLTAGVASASMPATFQPSANASVVHFHSQGAETETSPQLQITYASRHRSLMLRLSVFLAATLLFVWIRKRSIRLRRLAAVAGIIVPAALLPWSAPEWHPCLDGLFFSAMFFAISLAWKNPRADATRLATPLTTHHSPEDRNVLQGPLAAGLLITAFVSSSVTLSAAETAKPSTGRKDRSANGFVTAAAYTITLAKGPNGDLQTANVSADFTIITQTDAPTDVPLPLGRVALQTATLDGQPATCSWSPRESKSNDTQADVRPVVVVPQAGRHLLRLTFRLPLQRLRSGSARQFTLPVRPVPAGRAVLEMPSANLRAEFQKLVGQPAISLAWKNPRADATRLATPPTTHHSLITHHSSQETSRPTVTFPVDKSRDVVITLSPRDHPPVTHSSMRVTAAATEIEITDGGLFQRERFTCKTTKGRVSAGTFRIPNGLKVLGVTGSDVADWEFVDSGNKERTIRVDFRRSISDAVEVKIHLFRPVRISSQVVPLKLHPVLPTESTAGERSVNLFADAHFRIRAANADAAQPTDPKSRDEAVSGERTPRLALRITNPDAGATIHVQRRTPRTHVNAEHSAVIGTETVRVASRLAFDFCGSPRSKVALMLPDGFLLHSLKGSHEAEWSFGEDESMVNVVFPNPQSGTVELVLVGTQRRDGASTDVELSFPGPIMADRLDVLAGVWNSPAAILNLRGAQGWERDVDATPATVLVRSAFGDRTAPPDVTPAAVLRTSALEPSPLTWTVSAVPPRLQADAVTVVTVTDAGVHYTVLLTWRGVFGASPAVTFSVPSWLGDRLRFRRNGGLQIQPAGKTPEGRRRWIVSGFDRKTGRVAVVAAATLPPPIARGYQIKGPLVTMQQPKGGEKPQQVHARTFVDVSSFRQYVAVVNRSEGRIERLSFSKKPRIAVDDLPAVIRLPKSVRNSLKRAADFMQMDAAIEEPAWRLKPALKTAGIAGVVKRAELTTQLADDGSWRMQAVYRIRNRGRRFLTVELPKQTRLLSAAVAGKPASVRILRRKQTDWHLVCLPHRRPRTSPIDVRLMLSGRLNSTPQSQGLFRSAMQVTLPVPRIVSREDDPALGMPVEQTFWTVHLAEGMSGSVVSGSNFTNLAETDRAATGRMLLSKVSPTSPGLSASEKSVDLPPFHAGRTLTFQKPGGAPQLTMKVQSREARVTNRCAVWTLVWTMLGVAAVIVIVRRRRVPSQHAP